MKVFSTIKKYNKFVPDGAAFIQLDNFPEFQNVDHLLDLHYDFLKQDDEFVTMQITGFFSETLGVPTVFISDNFQVIDIPRIDSNTDLGVLGAGIQAIFLQGFTNFRFTNIIPISTNEFENKYMFIQTAFQFL